MKNKIQKDTADFLEALLWAYPENEDGTNPMDGYTVHDFSPEFTAGVSAFITGFRAYCAAREIEIPDSPRTFGGNVYFSLSGHGVGFWDSDDTEHLQAPLVAYSGRKYRFEQIDLSPDASGKLDLSFIPEALPKYRARLFSTPVNSNL